MSSRVNWWPSPARIGVEVGWTIIWMDLTLGIQVTSGGLMVAGKGREKSKKKRLESSRSV